MCVCNRSKTSCAHLSISHVTQPSAAAVVFAAGTDTVRIIIIIIIIVNLELET